jgi:hypothetical protein
MTTLSSIIGYEPDECDNDDCKVCYPTDICVIKMEGVFYRTLTLCKKCSHKNKERLNEIINDKNHVKLVFIREKPNNHKTLVISQSLKTHTPEQIVNAINLFNEFDTTSHINSKLIEKNIKNYLHHRKIVCWSLNIMFGTILTFGFLYYIFTN